MMWRAVNLVGFYNIDRILNRVLNRFKTGFK